MIKRIGMCVVLAFALLGSGIASSAGTPASAPASAVASQTAPVMQLASLAQAPASVQVTPLSVAQMSDVQGDGLWKKFKKALKKIVKKVIGVIVQEILNVISEWLEEILSNYYGGETQESTDVQTKDYASQADYEAGNAYSDYTENHGWIQTSFWYDCRGGGTVDNSC